jgi:hypothetical protein
MSPWNAGFLACGGNSAGQNSIAKEAFGLMQLTGINVRFAGVSGGIDQEFRPVRAQRRDQGLDIGIIEIGTFENSKCYTLSGQ